MTKKKTEDKNVAQNSKVGKKILITTLAASVGVNVTNYEAMAHGNRSSHGTTLAANWAPERYVLMREQLTNPSSPQAQQLQSLYDDFDRLSEQGISTTDVQRQIASIESGLKLSPVSKQVVGFISAGEDEAARATIEGVGALEAQLDAISWMLSDVAYQNSESPILSDASTLPSVEFLSFLAIEKAGDALQIAETNPADPNVEILQTKAASVLHNAANYCLPDVGSPTENSMELGSKAAEQGLRIRESLDRDEDIARSLIVAARYDALNNEEPRSSSRFERAKRLARAADNDGIHLFARVMELNSSPELSAKTNERGRETLLSEVRALRTLSEMEFAAKDSAESTRKDTRKNRLSNEDVYYLEAILGG